MDAAMTASRGGVEMILERKLLLADDDIGTAEEVATILRDQPESWQVKSVANGREAMDALQDEDFDILLSDAWLPDMDGAALVKLVKRIAPDMGRIVLCNRSELEATTRSIPIAHQIVAKPCTSRKLANVVSRARFLREILREDGLQELVGRIDKMPALPRIYRELTQTLRDPNAGAADVAEIIRQDIGMTAKALQLANSAAFGATQKITNIRVAVACLGFNLIKNLVLNVTLFRRFDPTIRTAGLDPESLQSHAFRTGSVAYRLLEHNREREDAFTAGMLHDVGKLILASELSHDLTAILRRMASTEQPMHQVEREILQTSHAEIGGHLLMAWGLPYPIVEAVAHHHDPARVEHLEFDVLPAVSVANALVGEWETELGIRPVRTQTPLDLQRLERWGVADRLPEWRKLTAGLCSDTHAVAV
jgi:HD-like signal output (HDOD) protein/ActR/RegA family two-component response regulator